MPFQWSSGRGLLGAEGKRFLFPILPNPENQRQSKTHTGFTEPQQIHEEVDIHMFSLASIIPSLDPRDWYATLNLKDSYFHVSVISRHRRFLCFMVNWSHYQFTVLPFGLSAAPRVFTKCMAVVASESGKYRSFHIWMIG